MQRFNVRFSNRPFKVKRFQTTRHYNVDAARAKANDKLTFEVDHSMGADQFTGVYFRVVASNTAT